jgi:hypothetical protein
MSTSTVSIESRSDKEIILEEKINLLTEIEWARRNMLGYELHNPQRRTYDFTDEELVSAGPFAQQFFSEEQFRHRTMLVNAQHRRYD